MTAPRVTVGLAVYNGANYLAEAIESVLNQTYQDFELVISDNASTDATEEICRDFAARDPRVRYVRHPQNRGASANFNYTVELARGEYFKWFAHDDVIGPRFLERTVAALDRDPSLILCHTRTGTIDSHGDLIETGDERKDCELQQTTPEIEATRLKLVDSPRAYQRYLGVLIYSIRCYEVFGLVRTTAMRASGLYRPYHSGEKVFLADLSLMGRFAEIPEILSFSRWHPERFSSRGSVRAQSAHIRGTTKRSIPIPRQVRSTCGYLMSIFNARLSLFQRVCCLGVLGRFVLRAKKWKSIFLEYLRGAGQTVEMPSEAEMAERPRRHWTSLDGVHAPVEVTN